MKYQSEFRDPDKARQLSAEIRRLTHQPWRIMEVCGGQTHTIVRQRIDQLLPDEITLVHGPGCPVCVTPTETLDMAIELARRPNVCLCSFGDMLRVPGSSSDLMTARAEGGDVRVVYSPLDALEIARQHPTKEVVFLAVGFETTAPANGMAVWQAAAEGIDNFSVLVSHVTVPAALEFLLAQDDTQVDAFLAAGHVCAVMGWEDYEPLALHHRRPIIVTGFELLDILEGILMAVRQLEAGTSLVENQYARVVRREGNQAARQLMAEVFELVDRPWRGIGVIPGSGLALREAWRAFDAEQRFNVSPPAAVSCNECLAGQVLQGKIKPDQCPAFGKQCTPERPLGAPMVSSEGACAAYYRYGREEVNP